MSIAWHHNVLTEMFTITAKISSFIRKSQIFDQPQPKWASSCTASILQINSAWYNLESRGRLFFFFKYIVFLDVGKVNKIYY